MDNDVSVTMSLFDSQAVKLHKQLESWEVIQGFWSLVSSLDNGWCYVSCSNCIKKLQHTVSAFTCLHCTNTNAVGVLRYRVEMSIEDETAEGLFVCFGRVMTKLNNTRAYEADHVLAGDGLNPEDTQAPPFVAGMECRTYTFQVKVGAYNFTANHQTFMISRILSEGDRMPLRKFIGNGGDDDNGDNNSGAISVRSKVDTGGSSQRIKDNADPTGLVVRIYPDPDGLFTSSEDSIR
ncbi:Uncharacterized protein Rs2_10204 [Raphanus sativus]|nr:Uncharacterized protein Rs2_10204 [Raphanus sativus]